MKNADDELDEYDDAVDYCGVNRRWHSRLVPRTIYGVDVNCRCYYHDKDYADATVAREVADRRFRDGMRADIRAVYGRWNPLRYLAFARAQVYYLSVRALGGKFRTTGNESPGGEIPAG